MDRGTYVAASGGAIQLRKLEIVNANLANVNTPGFKREFLVTEAQSFDDTLASVTAKIDPYARPDHVRTPGAINSRAVTDFSPGPIQNTNNPLDVALRDPHDFFAVNTVDGGVQYTRAGNFTLNSNGELCTPDGAVVQGDGGAITVSGPGAKIAEDGSVIVNGRPAGKLQVVRIENVENVERTAGTRFKLKGGAAPNAVDPQLVPGALEMSNVNTIGSVIDLITTTRAFEMYTKTAQTIDQMNQTAISQVGRR